MTLDPPPPLDDGGKIAIGVIATLLLLVLGYFGLKYNLLARLRGGLERNPNYLNTNADRF